MHKKQKNKKHLFDIYIHIDKKVNMRQSSSSKGKKDFFISQGDDYQILFTANSSKSRIISKIARTTGIKISKIGKICSNKKRSVIIDEKGKEIVLKNKGYVHQF